MATWVDATINICINLNPNGLAKPIVKRFIGKKNIPGKCWSIMSLYGTNPLAVRYGSILNSAAGQKTVCNNINIWRIIINDSIIVVWFFWMKFFTSTIKSVTPHFTSTIYLIKQRVISKYFKLSLSLQKPICKNKSVYQTNKPHSRRCLYHSRNEIFTELSSVTQSYFVSDSQIMQFLVSIRET